jgi:hypothetical protein
MRDLAHRVRLRVARTDVKATNFRERHHATLRRRLERLEPVTVGGVGKSSVVWSSDFFRSHAEIENGRSVTTDGAGLDDQRPRHILPSLAARRTTHGSGLGRVRYDKRADIHEAFLSLGCALICWHSLRKTWVTGERSLPVFGLRSEA